jgi:hypothetical protein
MVRTRWAWNNWCEVRYVHTQADESFLARQHEVFGFTRVHTWVNKRRLVELPSSLTMHHHDALAMQADRQCTKACSLASQQ